HLGFVEAASLPVVACTAWQMVFDYGAVDATKRVLVHGTGGNVGAYAVQLAKRVAGEVIDARTVPFDDLTGIDVVLDLVGGETQDRSFAVLKPGGVLVSAVSTP